MTDEQDVSQTLRLGQNSIIQPLLTDLYQITMAYAYWKSGRINDTTAFDLFFRKNPFQGEFTIFAGLEECLKFLENFHYSDSDIQYLRETLPPTIENEFFDFLRHLTVKDVTVYAIDEGSVTFPREPLMRVEGPLIAAQILETTLLTLVNYASLMATNAARYRMAAGGNLKLLEFGLRRAQGPDGGLSASKYSYIGGFDGTSNVLAGKLFNIPVRGTHAHAFITSFSSVVELEKKMLAHRTTGVEHDLSEMSTQWRDKLAPLFKLFGTEANDGELAALISFAIAFPDGFVALVDTYDVKRYSCRMPNTNITLTPLNFSAPYGFKVRQMSYSSQCIMHSHTPDTADENLRSGLLNFCAVAMALNDLDYKAIGIRIDSGDLAYLSNVARHYFIQISQEYNLTWFADLMIMASNDINEDTILSLNEQGHQINCFGIGTHLVTCQRQPALGCVYKMVEINGQPRMKLSQDVGKVTMPGRKEAYRLYGSSGHALIDLLQRAVEPPPEVGEKVLCRHPFEESKRAYVIPTKVERLLKLYWQNGKIVQPLPTLEVIRTRVTTSLKTLRTDIKRNLNPTPFKVAVSDRLYGFIHDLWLENAPIGELS